MMQANERLQQEEALRCAVLAGDEAAWAKLYDAAYAELWAYVVWRCAGLRDLAEEVTQETWLVAVRRIGAFEPRKGRFQSWLRGIAAKVVQNYFRARRRRSEQSLTGREESKAIEEEERRREQAELIARALAEMPERQEAVLRAKYLDQMSVEQIGAEWGETAKAIESLLSRARQAFRAAYEGLTETGVILKETKP